ncbi:MAG: C39 family peptidase [Acidobacteriota bacterium]|nr:C39 family peptidase [Acidobacteriota bacterium]
MLLSVQVAAWLLASGAPAADAGAGVRLDVPFVRQEKNGCGAASLAMVMRYWQRQAGRAETADAGEIQRALYSPRARGIYASGMERYLRRHGFETFTIRGTWGDLRHHLEKGRPLLVALQVGRGDLHYVVVTGLDERGDLILEHDPSDRGFVKQHRADFEREWNATGDWTLLALPK